MFDNFSFILYLQVAIPFVDDRSSQKFLLGLQDRHIFNKSKGTDDGLPEKELRLITP